MISLILLAVFTALSWIFFHIGDENGWDGVAVSSLILGTIFTAVLIFSVVFVAQKSVDAEQFHADKVYYQDLVNNLGPNVSLKTVERVVKRCDEINERISRNEKYSNSKFAGIYFIEDISKEEPIKIPDLYLKDFTINDVQ